MVSKKAGRPKKSERKVTPQVLEEIGGRYLRGNPLSEIAQALELSYTTVRYHLEHSIRPAWKERLQKRLDEELARVAKIEATAWRKFRESCEPK